MGNLRTIRNKISLRERVKRLELDIIEITDILSEQSILIGNLRKNKEKK